MAAYVISEVEVTDEELAQKYRQIAAASIEEYDGQYLARGAKAEVIEGEPTKRQIVIVKFASMERAREWYASPEYSDALKLARKALDRRLMFVEGVPDLINESS